MIFVAILGDVLCLVQYACVAGSIKLVIHIHLCVPVSMLATDAFSCLYEMFPISRFLKQRFTCFSW